MVAINQVTENWIPTLIGHAARVRLPGVDASLAGSSVSPDRGEVFWAAVQAMGCYHWYAEVDYDQNRRQRNTELVQALLEAQQDVAQDVVQAAVQTASGGGLWLKALAARSLDRPKLYVTPALRIATDVDVWFAEHEVLSIATWLKVHAGYTTVEQGVVWPQNYEMGLVSPEGVLLDIHDALGPRKELRNWFGRLTPHIQAQAQSGTVQALSADMQLVHAVVHFFQHAGHLKYYQLLEMLMLMESANVREAARTILLDNGYDQLWAWVVLRISRLWPTRDIGKMPAFLGNEKAALPSWQRRLWDTVLDQNGIWRGPQPYRGPKALTLMLGL